MLPRTSQTSKVFCSSWAGPAPLDSARGMWHRHSWAHSQQKKSVMLYSWQQIFHFRIAMYRRSGAAMPMLERQRFVYWCVMMCKLYILGTSLEVFNTSMAELPSSEGSNTTSCWEPPFLLFWALTRRRCWSATIISPSRPSCCTPVTKSLGGTANG